MSDFEYDVALSFAGEDRLYASDVARVLKARGIQVFYDEFDVAGLWGQDLFERLDEIYRAKSRYAIVFASASYAQKMWTNHERRSAQARALEEKGTYLLPVRLDDSKIPGLRPTVAYLDASQLSPAQIADTFEEKLRRDGNRHIGHPAVDPSQMGVPLTGDEKQLLLSVRPPLWEYLLFAGGIWQTMSALESKYLDHELGYARTAGEYVADDDIFDFIQQQFDRLGTIAGKLETILDPAAQERAFGTPDEPGDAIRIEHLSKRFSDVYEELMDCAAAIRGTPCNSEFRSVDGSSSPPCGFTDRVYARLLREIGGRDRKDPAATRQRIVRTCAYTACH